jgi:hypothetical protein
MRPFSSVFFLVLLVLPFSVFFDERIKLLFDEVGGSKVGKLISFMAVSEKK